MSVNTPAETAELAVASGTAKANLGPAKINGVPLAGQSTRSSRPLTLSYNVRNESDTSVWGYDLNAAFNTPGSSAVQIGFRGSFR